MILDGKTALVTGASRGIGRAIALALAAEGAQVAINFAGNVAAAEEVKSLIENNGGKAILVQADVADAAQVEEMVGKVVAEFGRIDILVNNAGITKDGLLLRMKEDQWDAVRPCGRSDRTRRHLHRCIERHGTCNQTRTEHGHALGFVG